MAIRTDNFDRLDQQYSTEALLNQLKIMYNVCAEHESCTYCPFADVFGDCIIDGQTGVPPCDWFTEE